MVLGRGVVYLRVMSQLAHLSYPLKVVTFVFRKDARREACYLTKDYRKISEGIKETVAF